MSSEAKVNPRQFVQNLLQLQYREVMMMFATGVVLVGAAALYPGADNIGSGIQADVGASTLVLFFAVAVVAAVVKGAIGFGYALIATPIFATVVDPTMAVVVLTIPPWMINVFQVGETNTGLAYVRREWLLILLALAGSFVGVFFLSEYSTGPVIPFLIGLLLLAYVVFEIAKDFIVIEEAHNPLALGSVGFGGGFLLGAANLGPLLPAYLHTFERNTERYVGGLSMIFLFVFSERIVLMWFNGLLTPYRLWLGCMIALVTIIGLLIGTYVRRLEIDQQRFNYVVIAILFVIAMNIFRQTVPALFF